VGHFGDDLGEAADEGLAVAGLHGGLQKRIDK
jgi:hypothetical protein